MEKCFACGKDESFEDNVCIDCFIKKNNIIKNIEKITLRVCPICGKGNFNYEYKEWEELKKDLIERIKKEVRLGTEFSLENIYFDHNVIEGVTEILMNTSDTRFLIEVNLDIKYQDKVIPYRVDIPVITEKKECDICSKLASDGFSATLQVRSLFDKNIDKIISFLKKEIKKEKDEVVEIDEKKEGVNFKFFSKSFAYNLLRRLKKRFYGYMETTRTLHTFDHQSSKKVFRSMFLYTYVGLKKDEYFIFNNTLYRIKDERKMIAYSKTHKKKFFLDELKRAKLPQKRNVMIINKSQAIDMETSEHYNLEKFVPQSEINIGEEREAVLYDNKIIL